MNASSETFVHALRQRPLAASLCVVVFLASFACGESLPASEQPIDPPARDSGVDAAPHVPTCFGAKFEKADLVTELSSDGEEQSVMLSPDEREVFVGTTRDKPPAEATNYDIWTSRRENVADPFPPLVRVDALSSAGGDYATTLTNDGIIFSSQRAGDPASPQRLFYDPRIALATGFDPAFVVQLDLQDVDGQSTGAPFLTSDNVLYFSRGTPDAYRIMRAKLTGKSTFAAPEDVTELNADGSDTFGIVVSNDGKTIYFGTDGRAGTQGADIFIATRDSATGPFSTPVRVDDPILNTPQEDRPGFLSTDGCRMYIVSNRGGGALKHVYLATRTPK